MAYQVSREVPFRSGGYDGPHILGAFGEGKTPCPPFKFICSCPKPDFHCSTRRKDLCDRILGAIDLAKKAAARLEAKPRSTATMTLFRDVFDEPPSEKWPVPGHPSRTISAGDLVAQRFRVVANELLKRETLYKCVNYNCKQIKNGNRCSDVEDLGVEVRPPLSGLGIQTEQRPWPDVVRPAPSPESPSRSCHPTDVIVVDTVAMAVLCKDQVLLCPDFWTMTNKVHQNGTILHEMFHLCFGLTCSWFQHDHKERRKNSAYCYEVFACGGAADPSSVSVCRGLKK